MGKAGISPIVVVVFLSFCALVQPISAKYSGGSGELGDPYQIATANTGWCIQFCFAVHVF